MKLWSILKAPCHQQKYVSMFDRPRYLNIFEHAAYFRYSLNGFQQPWIYFGIYFIKNINSVNKYHVQKQL